MLDLPALYAECAPQVHATTMDRVVFVESGRRVLAINVNRLPSQAAAPRPAQPQTVDEAVALAETYIARGHSVDLGLAQVNSRNLPAMGYSVRMMFEQPCRNLAAGAAILAACYDRALRAGYAPGDPALVGALSCYNTGSLTLGVQIGYTSRYGVVPPPTAQNAVVAVRSPATPPPPRRINPMAADMTVAGWEGVVERLP